MLGTTPGDPALADIQAAGNGPVEVPTLYLHGADDGCIGVELVCLEPELRLALPSPAGLELEIVPASGHFLHLDQPEAVNRRILKFPDVK